MKKTRNFSGLVIYSHLKDISALRAVKRDADDREDRLFSSEIEFRFRRNCHTSDQPFSVG